MNSQTTELSEEGSDFQEGLNGTTKITYNLHINTYKSYTKKIFYLKITRNL